MNAPVPVNVVCPDGVERNLRFTLGARRRISTYFGMEIADVLTKIGDGAVPGLLHAMLWDEKSHLLIGVPESIPEFEEQFPGDAGREYLAAIMSAMSQGKASKKDIETLLDQAQRAAIEKLTGLTSSPSARNVSDLIEPSSGTVISNANSSPASSTIEENSEIGTSDSELSPQRSSMQPELSPDESILVGSP
jgi:hypothetical protein